MRVLLTGFMGAGKSAVGRLLASRGGVPFRDLDREVETAAGRTIPEIFAESGETHFRQLEAEALARLLGQEGLEDAVVATGGGTVAQPAAAALLADAGLVVWLDVPFPVLTGRLSPASRARRPLFRDPVVAERLYEDRRDAYARAADLTITVTADDEVTDVVRRIEAELPA